MKSKLFPIFLEYLFLTGDDGLLFLIIPQQSMLLERCMDSFPVGHMLNLSGSFHGGTTVSQICVGEIFVESVQ